MLERSHPCGSEPESLTPEVAMISVVCVQPIGCFALLSARCRMAIASLGYTSSRGATSSAIPRWRRIFATWMPAVDTLVSGTKIASAASNTARRLGASGAETSGSASRTASAVSTRPMSEIELVATSFSRARSAIKAAVRTTMSADVPPRNLSAMAPTAPNSPPISSPVCSLNFGMRLATNPCAAPPLKMLKLVMMQVPSPQSDARA